MNPSLDLIHCTRGHFLEKCSWGMMALAWFLAGATSSLCAQTQEVQPHSKITGLWVKEMVKITNTPVDVKKFPSYITFRQVSGKLNEQGEEAGVDIAIVIDMFRFSEENPGIEIYDAPMNLAHMPSSITVGGFLREILKQLPSKDATIVVRPGYFEITTNKAVEEEGLSTGPKWEPLGWLLGREDPRGITLDRLERSPLVFLYAVAGFILIAIIVGITWFKKRNQSSGLSCPEMNNASVT